MRPRTPHPRVPLTRARITTAATALADDRGLTGLSMRALATELGVEAMSLYHHVRDKEELLDGMVDALFAQFYVPVVGGEWRAELRRRARSARTVLLAHPWAIALMDSRSTPGPATQRHHDAVLGCLRAAGFSWELAGHAFALLDAHLYGYVVQEAALPATAQADIVPIAEALSGAIAPGDLPYLQEFTRERVLAPDYDFAGEFDFGLEIVLAALSARNG